MYVPLSTSRGCWLLDIPSLMKGSHRPPCVARYLTGPDRDATKKAKPGPNSREGGKQRPHSSLGQKNPAEFWSAPESVDGGEGGKLNDDGARVTRSTHPAERPRLAVLGNEPGKRRAPVADAAEVQDGTLYSRNSHGRETPKRPGTTRNSPANPERFRLPRGAHSDLGIQSSRRDARAAVHRCRGYRAKPRHHGPLD